MNVSIQRYLSLLTLSAWGGILLYIYWSGRIASFLHPFFRPFVLSCGIGLLLLTVGYWWASRKSEAHDCCGSDHSHDEEGEEHSHQHDGCTHDHPGDSSFGRIASFVILLIPLLTAAAFSPDEFSRSTMDNRGFILDASQLQRPDARNDGFLPPEPGGEDPAMSDYLPRTADGNIKAEIIDLLFGAEDEIIRTDFEGQTVEVVGQIMEAKESNPGGNRQKLVRMFMVCCAADARPVAILLEDVPGESLAEMSWVRVIGKATFPQEGGRRLVVVRAVSIAPTHPPEETMLY